jgi:zinc/manganese transport system substrate-binding protein
MKRIFLALICMFACELFAKTGNLGVVTAYPYIASIAENIGKDRIAVNPLARGDYDPHVITPKPSYIGKLRNADLLIINGAQLEIGWLPSILNQAANPDIQPGNKGFLDLSRYVTLIEVPTSVSRGQGDVHPDGNPHFILDPDNVPPIADAITDKLCELDPNNEPFYRKNHDEFLGLWNKKLEEWNDKMRSLNGVEVIEYHKIFDYFICRFGLILAGTVEPLPGIPPTSRHIQNLEGVIQSKKIKLILQDVYNPKDASLHLSKKFGIKMVLVPHDVGTVKEVTDIFSLFDEIVGRILQ